MAEISPEQSVLGLHAVPVHVKPVQEEENGVLLGSSG